MGYGCMVNTSRILRSLVIWFSIWAINWDKNKTHIFLASLGDFWSIFPVERFMTDQISNWKQIVWYTRSKKFFEKALRAWRFALQILLEVILGCTHTKISKWIFSEESPGLSTILGGFTKILTEFYFWSYLLPLFGRKRVASAGCTILFRWNSHHQRRYIV